MENKKVNLPPHHHSSYFLTLRSNQHRTDSVVFMNHNNTPFIHERAKFSLDSQILNKWDQDLSQFLNELEEHKKLPEPQYSIYVYQYTSESMAGSSNYTDDPNCTNKDVQNRPTVISEPTYVTQIFCTPDSTIGELKKQYYNERIKAQKRRAKAAFYRRIEREGGPRKLEQILEREAQEKAELGTDWVDPLDVVLPEEFEQCCYSWGFLSVEDFEIAEAERKTRTRQGQFVPARLVVTNLRYSGQYLKDYHTLDHYGVPPGSSIIHSVRFPETSELVIAQDVAN